MSEHNYIIALISTPFLEIMKTGISVQMQGLIDNQLKLI